MKTIAVWTQKGGVGKTTTAGTVGHALALQGKRVLLIDADPQYNLTTLLGIPQEHVKYTLLDVFKGAEIEKCLIQARPNLSLLGSAAGLAKYPQAIDSRPPELALKRRFENLKGWDYVIFDCPPGSSLLIDNVLCYVTDVWAPLQAEFFSLDGLKQVSQSLSALTADFSPHVTAKLAAIIPTMFDQRTVIGREVVETARSQYGVIVTEPVRRAIRMVESPSHGLTILEYDAESTGAVDYLKVTEALRG